jgi:hypothetical protein
MVTIRINERDNDVVISLKNVNRGAVDQQWVSMILIWSGVPAVPLPLLAVYGVARMMCVPLVSDQA